MAVEILIRLKDGPSGRERGDIVSIKPVPNRGWGKGEGPPNYKIIRLETADYRMFKRDYCKRHEAIVDAYGKPISSRRSKYKMDPDTKHLSEKAFRRIEKRR